MPAVHLQEVTFSYASGTDVLENVTVHIGDGWTGVVGANGAGKSTLLSLIAGELSPSSGKVILDPPAVPVARCRQEVDDVTPEIRAFSEATDGLSRKWSGLLEIDPLSIERWETLSPGERKRWQLGAALSSDPTILLLDEPTNHLDAKARNLVEGALGHFRGVGLVISHNRGFLDRLTKRTLRIKGGVLRLWSAPYTVALGEWTAEEAAIQGEYADARQTEKKLRRRLADERRAAQKRDAAHARRLRTADRKDHDARSLGTKARHESGRMAGEQRRTVLRSALDRAREDARRSAPEKSLGSSVFFDFQRSPKRRILRFSGLLRAGSVSLCDHVEAVVNREDRIRLVGPNGAGKSTLLRALLDAATVPSDRILHLPQELTREEGIHLLNKVRGLPGERRGRVLTVVAALGLDPDELLLSARPSPGEARKLAIALGLGVGVWAMLLDEPTNHLDLPSVERIESALEAYPGALVVVTHDDRFGARTTSTLWSLDSGVFSVSGFSGAP